MANRSRFRLVFPVALVALALAEFGCGGGGGSGGTGGAGGKAGHSGAGGGTGGGALGGASGGGTSGGGISGGVSGGGTSGGGVSGGGTSGGGTSGGGTAGGGTAGGGNGGRAGAGGEAGHAVTDGGQDAATDAGRQDGGTTDAHHEDASADAHGDAEVDSGAPTCTNACVLGSHRCAGGGSETCVTASDGCTVWGTAAACQGVTTCVTGTGVCTCPTAPPRCTAAGTFCNTNGDLVTCTKDAQGCFAASAPQACPTDESCKGTLPNAACSCDNDPSCNGTNSFCMNAATAATCGSDSNQPACNVVVSTTTCGGSSTCVGGACVCPAAGTTAGTGCSTLNATICSGTDILTCVTETASLCSIWQASTHCGAGGLTCGTKAGSGPACQCPENTGTDVYVDPAAGSDLASGLFPTGIQSPAACRYASLTKGLSVVGSPGQIVADSATLPAVFGGETFPLAIPAGVKVVTADATPKASDYVISYGGGTNAVILGGDGSELRGFSVEGSATADGLVKCSGGTVTLDTVVLDGGSKVKDGLDVMASCNANLQSVTISNFAAIALNMTSSGTTNVTGGVISAASEGIDQSNGTIIASGVTVQNNATFGVRLSSGSPSLTITGQSAINDNGITGNFAGVSIASGSASLTNTQVAGNTDVGIDLASAGPYSLTTVQSSNNTKAGVSLSSGALTASGLSSTSNGADGITVAGGSASLTNSTLSSNGGNGLSLTAAVSADVSGGTIKSNTTAGISASIGTLTVHGGAEIASNASGLQLTGATATVTGANVHDNTGSGIVVNQATGAPIVIGSSSTTTTIAKNQQQGIVVQSSPAVSGSGANSVTIDTAAVTGNGSFGIYLEGNNGSVAATIKGSSITANADTGLMIEQSLGKTTEAIQNNDVSGNNTQATPRNVGGILFNTSSTLTSFIGNTVHSNAGDELGFNGLPGGGGTKWTITPPSNACDSTANSIYCYGAGHVGLQVLLPAASVDAQHQHWSNNPPTSGIDFTGSVTVTNPCSAITTTCP